MMKTRMSLAATLLVFAACSSPHAEQDLVALAEPAEAPAMSMDESAYAEASEAMPMGKSAYGGENEQMIAPMAGIDAQGPRQGADAQRQARPAPKVIRHARVNFEVEDIQKSARRITALAAFYNAKVVTDNLTNSDPKTTQEMVIRVRPADLDTLLAQILEEATYIEHNNITARDVTEEYVDITRRLKNKKAVADQYTALLKRAKNIKEILMVEEKLRVVREEIEAKEGRLKYLADQVGQSTINLYFYQKRAVLRKGPGKSFAAKLGDGFSGGWTMLQNLAIAITYTWPVWVLLALGFVAYRWRRSRRQQAQSR